MRQAPPVLVLCHGRHWRTVQAAVFGLAGAACTAWVASHLSATLALSAPTAALALVGFGLVFVAGWRLTAQAPLRVGWDGHQWFLDDEAGQVELMMHARRFVLLRLRTAAGTRWAAVGRGEAGPAWHGLLVALHGQALAVAPQAEGQAG